MAPDDEAWGDEGRYDAEQVQHSEEQEDQEDQVQDASPSRAPDSDSSGEVNDGEDSGDYDPESVMPASDPSGSPEPFLPDAFNAQVSKPKVSGGFLVADSDDDEDEDTEADSRARMAAVDAATVDVISPPLLSFPSSLQAENENSGDTTWQPMPVNDGGHVAPASRLISTPPRLNHVANPLDQVGVLEARVKEDPRGEMDSWLMLMSEYRRRNKLADLRSTYNRFLEVFPQAADVWVEWVELELDHDSFMEAEQLFGRSLLIVPNVQLWTVYLNYIRRRNDLTNDVNGQARRTVSQAYEFVIDNIGMDKDSGKIWREYIQFIRSGPGIAGGSDWQDQQKMDQLRKAYQRAISVPTSAINSLWRDYDQFEMGLNKLTGRKFIQERSPRYMAAKSAGISLENITRSLQRSSLPRLPPARGFEGDQEYRDQVESWRRWIAWERADPLELKDDEPEVYKQRVLYCYKQALMALRFWPELWVEAAEWCFRNNVEVDGQDAGLEFLSLGVTANPESVLLALKHADRIELTYPDGEDVESKSARAAAVRAPHDKVLDTLYGMIQKIKEREKFAVSILDATGARPGNGDRDGDTGAGKESKISAAKEGFAAETQVLSRTLSFVWIALARAMRRIQGKGSPKEGGLRQVFPDARQRGRLTSDVYVAVALIESVVYKETVGAKIFERGLRLFPEDENFMLEYIKFLHSKDDTTNARVTFEQCVNRLTQNPISTHKAKPLYAYFHQYESQYGELAQIMKLEERMEELFPEDPRLLNFSRRHSSDKFDPIAERIIVSPTAQLRPKSVMASVEEPVGPMRDTSYARPRLDASPRPGHFRSPNSPKRPFQSDDTEEPGRPRKLPRGESPLKGAAGRRLDQQRRHHASSLPFELNFFLSILPPVSAYDGGRIIPSRIVSVLRDTTIPDYAGWKSDQERGIRPGSAFTPAYPARDLPKPTRGSGSRPLSPFEGHSGTTAAPRLVTAGATYRNSPLRPEMSTTLEAAAPGDVTGAGPWAAPLGYAQPQYGGRRLY